MSGILIISAVKPYPADNGKKVVVSGFLEYFKEKHGTDNVRYLFLGNDKPTDNNGTHYDVLPLPAGLNKVWNVIYHSFIKASKSIQESILYSDTLRTQIHRYIIEMQPDLIVYDTIRTGQFGYPDSFSKRSILYMEDLFSVRYQKMLQNYDCSDKSQKLNALGNFAQHVPAPFRFALKYAGWTEKILLTIEKKLIWKDEASMPNEFRRSLLLNEDEIELLKSSSNANVKVMRPYLRMSSKLKQRDYNGSPTYIFLGVLNLPYNETGLLEFLDKAFPILLEQCPDAKLRVIGRNPTDRIMAAVTKFNGNVILEGYVDDLADILATCCGMIVPLLFGSGIKIKVLEALAHGVPMVTTSVGTMAIPLEHKVHCYIEEDISSFPKWLILLRDLELNLAMSCSSQSLFNILFSKQAIYTHYDDIFSV